MRRALLALVALLGTAAGCDCANADAPKATPRSTTDIHSDGWPECHEFEHATTRAGRPVVCRLVFCGGMMFMEGGPATLWCDPATAPDGGAPR